MQKPFMELVCDYCHESLKISLLQGVEQPAELQHWVKVVLGTGEAKDFCRAGCAINGLRLMSPIALSDALDQPKE